METSAASPAAAPTVTVSRRPDPERIDNRKTRSYGVTVRLAVRWHGFDTKGIHLGNAEQFVSAAVGPVAEKAPGFSVAKSLKSVLRFWHGDHGATLEVTALYERPRDIPPDPWSILALTVGGEDGITRTLETAVRAAFEEGAAARDDEMMRGLATTIASAIWSRAVEKADEEFAEELAAIHRRRAAAREAQFRALQAAVREKPELLAAGTPEKAIALATDPAVVVTPGAGPFTSPRFTIPGGAQ